MDLLEIATRTSIWLSVAAWGGAIVARLRRRMGPGARRLWTVGVAAYVVHVVAAFQRFYDWSHDTAVVETARQTLATTGVDTGSGLWLNYLVGVVWLGDTAYWWAVGDDRYRNRPVALTAALDGFLVFMIFNGTVVFGRGPVRWLGAVLFTGLAAMTLATRFQRRAAARP